MKKVVLAVFPGVCCRIALGLPFASAQGAPSGARLPPAPCGCAQHRCRRRVRGLQQCDDADHAAGEGCGAGAVPHRSFRSRA